MGPLVPEIVAFSYTKDPPYFGSPQKVYRFRGVSGLQLIIWLGILGQAAAGKWRQGGGFFGARGSGFRV